MEHELAVEQAKLSLAIQELRRELSSLHDEKELFLQKCEREALQRVTEALKTAKGVVKETGEYVAIVETLRQEAEAIVDQIKVAKITMQEQRREFAKQTETTNKALDARVRSCGYFTKRYS